MIDTLTIGGVALLAAGVVLVLLPARFDPAIRWKERQLRRSGVQPEMIPGRKNWQTSDGKRLGYLPIRGGVLCCPDCGKPTLLSGPSGGLSQNIACESCLEEFNIGHMDSPPVILDYMGKLNMARATIYGITPEEFAANPDSGWQKV